MLRAAQELLGNDQQDDDTFGNFHDLKRNIGGTGHDGSADPQVSKKQSRDRSLDRIPFGQGRDRNGVPSVAKKGGPGEPAVQRAEHFNAAAKACDRAADQLGDQDNFDNADTDIAGKVLIFTNQAEFISDLSTIQEKVTQHCNGQRNQKTDMELHA